MPARDPCQVNRVRTTRRTIINAISPNSASLPKPCTIAWSKTPASNQACINKSKPAITGALIPMSSDPFACLLSAASHLLCSRGRVVRVAPGSCSVLDMARCFYFLLSFHQSRLNADGGFRTRAQRR